MSRKITSIILAVAVVQFVPMPARAKDGEVETLVKAYSAAQEKWFKKNKNPTKRDYSGHPMVEYMPKFKALAEGKPKSAEALECMMWALENCKFLRYTNIEKKEEYYAWALKGLKDDFAADPAIAPRIRELIDLPFHYGPAGLGEVYESIIKSNSSRDAKSWAMVALGVSLSEYYGELGPRNSQVRADNRKRANELFKKVVEEYADCEAAAEAKRHLHALTDLSVGSEAPDFTGKDVEGKEIKLSSLRGKVVVVDFWTKDCDSCAEFHQTARELTSALKDKPFVWLGVNADPAPVEDIKKALEREGMTWPNVVDGGSRSISKAWNVDGFPMVFVLDAKGVIQRKGTDRQAIRKQVELLVERTVAGEKKPGAGTPSGAAPTGAPVPPTNPAPKAGENPKPPAPKPGEAAPPPPESKPKDKPRP